VKKHPRHESFVGVAMAFALLSCAGVLASQTAESAAYMRGQAFFVSERGSVAKRAPQGHDRGIQLDRSGHVDDCRVSS
jgi:hypothetical protein